MNQRRVRRTVCCFTLVALFAAVPAGLRAWGYEGHRTVAELALKSLPEDFPAWARAADNADRVRFLANVPDRWRNVEPMLKQSGGSWTDHYLDIEQLADAGLDARTVSSFRYDFIVAFAAGRAAHSEKFRPVDPAKNVDHTFEWPGFAPWAITEYYGKLKSAFSYLKTYEESGGSAVEIANAKADALYAMGIVAHYVGDCAQPLHTTMHHNGWVGENPNGYTKWGGFHSWIDSGFIGKAGIKAADLLPRVTVAQPIALALPADGRDPMFVAMMDYVIAGNALVEPLFALEKAGKLNHDDTPASAEGRAFMEGRLLAGGQMLGSVWLTAWRQAGPDTYLRTTLLERQQATQPKATGEKANGAAAPKKPEAAPAGKPTAVVPRPVLSNKVQVRPALFAAEKAGTLNTGPVALDAKWSTYGPYIQRTIEAVQNAWETALLKEKTYPKSDTAVEVKFRLSADGRVETLAVDGTADADGKRFAAGAITAGAPYGKWTDDMVAALGKSQEMTFRFFYQ